MSDTLSLKAEVRERVGSRQSAALRKAGKLPAVIYGHGQPPLSIALDRHEFVEGLHHGHRIFSVTLPEGPVTLLIKELQYDYLGKTVTHTDLIRVNLNERVTVEVPIEIRGTAKGTTEGGILDENLTSLKVECIVSRIPESIPVVVKDLGIGQAIHAREVPLPEGVTLVTEPEAIVCICHPPKVEAEEAPAAEAPEGPEVITERAPKEEAAE